MCGRTAATGFDAWAPTYEQSALQSTQQLMPRPKRVLDIGCGTGRLLRQARQQYPSAMLVGVDLAWGMVATAAAATTAELAIRHVRDAAACALSCHGEEVMTMVVHLSSWRRCWPPMGW